MHANYDNLHGQEICKGGLRPQAPAICADTGKPLHDERAHTNLATNHCVIFARVNRSGSRAGAGTRARAEGARRGGAPPTYPAHGACALRPPLPDSLPSSSLYTLRDPSRGASHGSRPRSVDGFAASQRQATVHGFALLTASGLISGLNYFDVVWCVRVLVLILWNIFHHIHWVLHRIFLLHFHAF